MRPKPGGPSLVVEANLISSPQAHEMSIFSIVTVLWFLIWLVTNNIGASNAP